jgi:hypothetical protein
MMLIIEYGRVRTKNSSHPHGFGRLDPENFTLFPKNPIIARFFRQIGRADELGSGMRKMMKYSRAYGGADPDSLLTEEKLALELQHRGFDLIEFSDPVEFRYAYESRYRSVWDLGEHTDLVVTLRLQGVDLVCLPYDLVRAGRKLFFNLGDLFPRLSYPVVEKLDRALLDQLYEAQSKSPPRPIPWVTMPPWIIFFGKDT